ncbi:3-hydroxybutyryl-CoA dehydrogenase [Hydrobacter penzbergensis]|uniref:3-hydroxybutyryl-CoA dehydrogenase n=1 Tax=Hydrobacter penzbergensis TaxID=1235997 RepID=A0A8X8IDT4_9BACT|nr:3-hydroxyacyl-CoA dehydrogenase family protein [Hydrobacter penzbergensis]SDW61508.1 3-hydroxybutyryl-CoA dehydrogenase [Hydrobacter penzbergensis]
MHIAIQANTQQKELLLQKGIPAGISVSWLVEGMALPVADAYFDFLGTDDVFATVKDQPVFINEVLRTGRQLPLNCIRVNAWNSFLERPVLEIAGEHNRAAGENILRSLNWKYQWVPDEPGFIAARIVCMIINEAYFALGQELSSKNEMDIAMKLGTNYPMGPFEWAEQIGTRRVYDLLKILEREDKRYTPSGLLEKEALQS